MTQLSPRSLVLPALLPVTLLLSACGGDGHAGQSTVPGDAGDTTAYNGISESETLTFLGNEPFWGGQVVGTQMRYSTPDHPEETLTVKRFAGRGGLSFSGEVGGKPFTMAVTPGTCSDQMSDRSYPFTVTFQIDGAEQQGCGYTDTRRFTGPENP